MPSVSIHRLIRCLPAAILLPLICRTALADLTPIYPASPFVNRGGGLGTNEGGFVSESDGKLTSATYSTHYTALEAVSTVQPVYANQATGENAVPNPITVKASVLLNGITIPLTFGGARTVTIQPGGYATPDPLPLTLTQGQQFAVLTNVSVAPGGVWATGVPATGQYGDQLVYRADATDTNTGWQNADAFAYAPVTVTGAVTSGKPLSLIGLSGDSIMEGQGMGGHEFGFGVEGVNASGLPWVRVALGGESAGQWDVAHNNRLRWLAGCDAVITNYGTNDISDLNNSVAQIKANLLADWSLDKSAGVKRIYQTTLTPGDWSAQQEAERTAINTWLRSGQAVADSAGALTGFFDTAAAVESDTTGGAVHIGGSHWASDYQYNQLHPSADGHAAMAAVLAQSLPGALAVPEASVPLLMAAGMLVLTVGWWHQRRNFPNSSAPLRN